MLARVLRPSARQVRNDFEKSVYAYGGQLDEDSSLRGLGIAASESESKKLKNAIESQDTTISELRKRVAQQESIATLLHRELAESTSLQQRFERQRFNMLARVDAIKNSHSESVSIEAMESYLAEMNGRVQHLATELSEGWTATQSLADLAFFQKGQLMFNHDLLDILRDRIISNIPHVAGAIFTSPPARKDASSQKRVSRPPPKATLTSFDESPELNLHAEEAHRIRSLEISLLPLLAINSDRSLKKTAFAQLKIAKPVQLPILPRHQENTLSPMKVSVLSVCGVTLPVRPKTATIRSVARRYRI